VGTVAVAGLFIAAKSRPAGTIRRPSYGGTPISLTGGIRPPGSFRTVGSMPPSLTAESLSKRFGSVVAVDELSFDARPGLVTGLVGPNGSGKTTTMRVALGLIRPSGGRLLVNGCHYRDLARPLHAVGALLDADAVNPGLSGVAHLRWLCRTHGLGAERPSQLLELVGLEGVATRRVGSYSLGMRQRLGIAAALVGDPGVLVFDEPMNGLDPEGMVWLRGLLRDHAAEGRIVLLSSHLMSELEGLADRLVVINHGRLVADTTVRALLDRTGSTTITVRTHEPVEVTALLASAGASVTSVGRDILEVDGLSPQHVAHLVAQHGLPLHGLGVRQATLEDVYLELTGNGEGVRP
jgi:ABC-2 type transport system ATP-binding protein